MVNALFLTRCTRYFSRKSARYRFESYRSTFSWLETKPQFSIFASLPNDAVMCQNQASSERWVQDYVLPVIDASAHRIYPSRQKEAVRVADQTRPTPYNVLSKLTARSTDSLPMRTATTQVAIDEAVVACALERLRLRTGQFPERLGCPRSRLFACNPARRDRWRTASVSARIRRHLSPLLRRME